MTDIERKMITDEIKGLLNGISSISCSAATSIDFSGVLDISSKMSAVKEYITRIENKVDSLKNATIESTVEDSKDNANTAIESVEEV